MVQAADKAWTDAIAIDPSNPNAWSNRGTSRLQFGRWQEAREDLLKALELESKNGEPSGVPLLACTVMTGPAPHALLKPLYVVPFSCV